jgi:hypothetical protein
MGSALTPILEVIKNARLAENTLIRVRLNCSPMPEIRSSDEIHERNLRSTGVPSFIGLAPGGVPATPGIL